MTDTTAQFRLKLKGLMGRINDPLYRNAFYILGATAVSAISGFIFWIIAARVTSPQDVGVASAALGSVVLLKSIADFGMASSMIYFASSNKEDISTLVGTTISFGWISGVIVSVIFIVGASFLAPGLIVFRQTPESYLRESICN